MLRKLKFHQNLAAVTVTVLEDQYTFMIKSRLIILKMRNVSENFVEKIKTYFTLRNFFFFKSHFLR
jgi:hypothetical protein